MDSTWLMNAWTKTAMEAAKCAAGHTLTMARLHPCVWTLVAKCAHSDPVAMDYLVNQALALRLEPFVFSERSALVDATDISQIWRAILQAIVRGLNFCSDRELLREWCIYALAFKFPYPCPIDSDNAVESKFYDVVVGQDLQDLFDHGNTDAYLKGMIPDIRLTPRTGEMVDYDGLAAFVARMYVSESLMAGKPITDEVLPSDTERYVEFLCSCIPEAQAILLRDISDHEFYVDATMECDVRTFADLVPLDV